MAYTNLLTLAENRGATPDDDGTWNGAALAAVGVPIMCECTTCGATIGAYSAYVDDDFTEILGGCCYGLA